MSVGATLRAAAALLLGLAACGGPGRGQGRDHATARAAPGPGEVVMTRLEACHAVAMEVCEAGRGCAWRDADDEYACRDWLVSVCCRDQGTCDQRVTVSTARLDACYREIEQSYDCDKLFTPACHGVIPAPQGQQEP